MQTSVEISITVWDPSALHSLVQSSVEACASGIRVSSDDFVGLCRWTSLQKTWLLSKKVFQWVKQAKSTKDNYSGFLNQFCPEIQRVRTTFYCHLTFPTNSHGSGRTCFAPLSWLICIDLSTFSRIRFYWLPLENPSRKGVTSLSEISQPYILLFLSTLPLWLIPLVIQVIWMGQKAGRLDLARL